MRPMTTGLSRAVVLGRAAGSLPVEPGEARIEGVITGHKAGAVAVLDGRGVVTRVRLNEATRISATKGVLRLRRERRSSADLIAGLHVAVEGVPRRDGFQAAAISFRAAELKKIRGGAQA